MTYSAKILADSITEAGHRLTTFEVTYPRIVHSELMTHRALSRNAASTRAIPFKKAIEKIENDLFVPIVWSKNGSGMVANEELSSVAAIEADYIWRQAARSAQYWARALDAVGVHKSLTGRILEPWMWITVLITATEWENFFHLRCAPDAEPHIEKIARMIEDLYRANTPKLITSTDPIPWHLPLVTKDDLECWAINELSDEDLLKISVGRCARVSYLTHDGKRDPQADIELHDRLAMSGHWSPFEHVATPKHAIEKHERSGNLRGWDQYRKRFFDENYTAAQKED